MSKTRKTKIDVASLADELGALRAQEAFRRIDELRNRPIEP